MIHLNILTTVWLLQLRGFCGEEQATCSKSLSFCLDKWWWALHAQIVLHFAKSRFFKY